MSAILAILSELLGPSMITCINVTAQENVICAIKILRLVVQNHITSPAFHEETEVYLAKLSDLRKISNTINQSIDQCRILPISLYEAKTVIEEMRTIHFIFA